MGPVDPLAFPWSGPFGGENPSFWGLEKLGFPWILSSESSLFNGLRWIFREQNFSRLFALEGPRGNERLGGRGYAVVQN
jgi:hypothetical protein